MTQKDIELFKNKFMDSVFRACGAFPVARGKGDTHAVRTANDLLEQNKIIGIFPEGYVSKTCELLPFRNGCFKIGIKADVPIAVCVINGTQELPKRIFRKRSVVDFQA